jgi:Protein of unknown function (DUF2608)
MKLRKCPLVLAGCATLILLGSCTQLATNGPQRTAQGPAESLITEIKNLAEVSGYLKSKSATLLVLDVDDTLLTSPVFFGSDRWYGWQSALPKGDPRKLTCLFEVGAMNYESGFQVPTQADGPTLINALPGDRLILTARGSVNRGATIRELAKAEYRLPETLSRSSEGIIYGYRSSSSSQPITVSYNDGVFMVAGQDKGLLLLDLLARLERKYERVVLVDDGRRNIEAMAAALKEAGIDYHGLWYTRIDKSKPTPEEEQAGVSGWETWQALLSKNYPGRLERIREPCAY